ncbi:MAG: BON domain-containing protein [Candidatus Dormibacteria bacterium]
MKKRRRILRLGGLGAVAAAVAAFFLHPRKGAGRRDAVRRGGGRLARRGAGVTALIGTRRRDQRGEAAELRARIAGALREELDPDGLALQVIAGDDGTVTVRGEVGSLEQIRHASEVIERARGDAEVVNLIRLRASAPGGAVTG